MRLPWVQVWAPCQGRGTGATQGGQTAARRQSRLPAVTASPRQRVGNRSHIAGPLLDRVRPASQVQVAGGSGAASRGHISRGSHRPLQSSQPVYRRSRPRRNVPSSPASSAVQLRRPGPWERVCLASLSHIRPAPQNCAAQAALTPSVMRRATRLLRHARLCKGSPGLGVGTRARSCLAYLFTL